MITRRATEILVVACITGTVFVARPAVAELNAEPPPAEVDSQPPAADRLLPEVILALENRHSVYAKLRHEIRIFGLTLFGSGTYVEQRAGPHPLLRLELRTQLGDETSTLLHVCDGRFLWVYQHLLGEESLTRIDVVEVQRALQRAGRMTETVDPVTLPGFGGLPQLLRGLHRNFDFAPAEPAELAGTTLWRARGRWKPAMLARLVPDQKEAALAGEDVDLSELGEHLPDQVHLFVGRDDLFPYRIEYHRIEPQRGSATILVSLQFMEVNLDIPVDTARFLYSPGDLAPSDGTDDFLRRLGISR